MEDTRERARLDKRWRDELEEDLHITGINNTHEMARDHWEWRKIVLQVEVHNGL
jgi:hypothetical protein